MMGMTGFGRCMMELPHGHVTVEVRTLNARGREILIRVQGRLAVDENALRTEVASYFHRGRIELIVSLVSTQVAKEDTLEALAVLDTLRVRLEGRDISLHDALLARLVLALERSSDTKVLIGTEPLLSAVRTACQTAIQARREEGVNTGVAIHRILEQINRHVQEIETIWPQHRNHVIERLTKRLQEANASMDSVFVHEIVQMADRADIGEEISRLQGHLQCCLKLLDEDKPVGRELDFVGQELLREANTIGSKCPETRIITSVIAIKSLSEQMRELVANLE